MEIKVEGVKTYRSPVTKTVTGIKCSVGNTVNVIVITMCRVGWVLDLAR